MARRCDICGKGPSTGNRISRRGKAKREGGVGKKITGIEPRYFRPNLQYVRSVVHGKTVRVRVCTGCLKAGRVAKPA